MLDAAKIKTQLRTHRARGHLDARKIALGRTARLQLCVRFDDATFKQITQLADEKDKSAAGVVRDLVARSLRGVR